MSTSDYKAQAELAKEKLNTVSPTMCLAKWNQVSLHLPTGLTNSCYHPPLHKIDAEAVKTKQEAEAWFEERQKVGSYVIVVCSTSF